MSDNVEHLMLDHLRAIRGDMARMADDVRTMRTEMMPLRQHVSGIVTLQEHDHGDIASIKARLERIEKRLDLVD